MKRSATYFFTASALPLVFATFKDDTAYLLQFERPARSRAETVEFDIEGDVVQAENYSEAELCLKEGQPFSYKKRSRQLQKF